MAAQPRIHRPRQAVVVVAKSASHGSMAVLLIALVWSLLAVLIYSPFDRQPLDSVDFSEFLPLLRASDSIVGRWSALTEYFASRSRTSVSAYGFIALNYEL